MNTCLRLAALALTVYVLSGAGVKTSNGAAMDYYFGFPAPSQVSGTFAGEPFSGVGSYIIALGDTANVHSYTDGTGTGYYVDVTQVGFHVDLLVTEFVNANFRVSVNNTNSTVELSRGAGGDVLILGPSGPTFANWDMTTPIDSYHVVIGPAQVMNWAAQSDLPWQYNDRSNASAVFFTPPAAAPEPAGVTLAAAGIAGLLAMRWRLPTACLRRQRN